MLSDPDPATGERTLRVRDRSAYRARMNELLELAPKRTAVVTVDLQRDYVDHDVGSNLVPEADAERVRAAAARLLDGARAMGASVVHAYVAKTQREYEAGVYGGPFTRVSTEHRLSQNALQGVREIPDRIAGSPQAEVPAELVAEGDLHVTSKRTNDAAFSTELPILLERVCRADAVLLCGINTDTCVYATAFTVSNLGYRPVVITDAVASTRGEDHHVMALELMSRTFCWALDAEAALAKLRAG